MGFTSCFSFTPEHLIHKHTVAYTADIITDITALRSSLETISDSVFNLSVPDMKNISNQYTV